MVSARAYRERLRQHPDMPAFFTGRRELCIATPLRSTIDEHTQSTFRAASPSTIRTRCPSSAAQDIVRQWALPRGRCEVERVRLFDALDRVLAEDVVSPINVPSHDNSAMDGYAFDGAALLGIVDRGAPTFG